MIRGAMPMAMPTRSLAATHGAPHTCAVRWLYRRLGVRSINEWNPLLVQHQITVCDRGCKAGCALLRATFREAAA